MTNQSPDDARLVQSAIAGDRRSFEEIVHRYRNLVCSIAYSGTGDFALSEDLAQNTFLTAWRNLAELREPGNLRAWLSAIVRRMAAGTRRKFARHPTSVPLPPNAVVAGTADPAEQLISQEERALVWQTLLQLPETYREPLILFYREEQSVRRVAEDLGLSEEAVKQRLSSGRQLLTERVMAVVEKTLRDSAPSGVFVAGVMALLPALAPQAVSAGMIAAGGKGSAAAKAALLGGTVSALLGPVLGLLAGLISVGAGMRSANSPRERRLMIRVGLLVFGYIALLNIFLAVAYALSYMVSMAVTRIVIAFPLWALNLLLGGIFTMVLTSLIYKSRHSYVGVTVDESQSARE